MMESIEKLRDLLKCCGCSDKCYSCRISYEGRKLIDEIEREIAERYVKLPLDADGVPWTQDDDVFVDDLGDVYSIRRLAWNPGVKQWYLLDQYNESFLAKKCRHVKERTVEDVLRDVWKEALYYAKSAMWRSPDKVFAERADELRDLLGGDAE